MEQLSISDTNPSKSALKKAAKDAKKEQQKAETHARLEAERMARETDDFAKDRYGNLPLNQSQQRPRRIYARIEQADSLSGGNILIRGRLHNSRGTGKQVFVVLRQGLHTIQALAAADDTTISRAMVKFIIAIPKESIVDIEGVLTRSDRYIESCTQHDHEIRIEKLHVVSQVSHRLPITIEDATRPEEETSPDTISAPHVNLDTRLNHRVIDLRTQTNQAIFSLASGINNIFRDFFIKNDFREIHTPKLISAASEGGANVFRVKYFEREAFLAQSPQLYKQMAIIADMERVFEIAPVFRAENSNTHRHMTEFIGVDLEMAIQEHYHEVLETIASMFVYLFEEIKARFSPQLECIRKQYPFEDLEFPKKTVVLSYPEAIALLRTSPEQEYSSIGDCDDMSTRQEKELGRLVKAKYGTDFYVVDKFPLAVRPFYTMPDPSMPGYSNSYDFFIRGEEILSGGQRIHDYDMLVERAKARNIQLDTIEAYLDAFKYGAPPHGGGGIGLERVIMFYLGIGNIRRTCMFPRDPTRLSP
jgi:aspartyl-tRNA synthetase